MPMIEPPGDTPAPDYDAVDLIAFLREKGVAEATAAWLSDALFCPAMVSCAPDRESLLFRITASAHAVNGHELTDAAASEWLVRCALRIIDEGPFRFGDRPAEWQAPHRRLRAVLTEWQQAGWLDRIDVHAVIAVSSPLGVPDRLVAGALRWLHRQGRCDPLRCLDRASLRLSRTQSNGSELKQPTRLAFWLRVLGPDALRSLRPEFEAATDLDLEALARGVHGQLSSAIHWACIDGNLHVHTDEAPHWVRLGRALAVLYEPLERRFGAAEDMGALGALWLYGYRALCGGAASHASPEESKRRGALSASARDALGRLRGLVRRLDEREREEHRARHVLDYRVALRILVHTEGLFAAIKPLLLLLRALPEAAVPPDLRYWSDMSGSPPPWSWVAQAPTGLIHAYARDEEQRDPELARLREQIGLFFIERLASRDRKATADKLSAGQPIVDDDLTEPSPIWRRCLIRALLELGTNPRGRGHQTLAWSEQHDPDAEVRRAAKDADKRVRHGACLPPKRSPRRAIIASLWWTRQAHRLELGLDVDARGAQRTWDQEARRTTERRDKTPST